MIIKVIRLQTHDDIISVCEEIGRGQARRVLLIWPERARLLNQKLDLVRLQRHSRKLGRQLGLVCKDSEVRYYAAELGLPWFSSERAAHSQSWRAGRRQRRLRRPTSQTRRTFNSIEAAETERQQRQTQPPPPLLRWGAFGLGVLALLALLAALLPAAWIQVEIPRQSQQTSLGVYASDEINQVNLAGGLPAGRMTVVVEGRDSLATSGSLRAPSAPAGGNVVFTNLTAAPVEIPLGLTLLPLPEAGSEQTAFRFVVTKSGVVPAGAGKTLSLPVQALQPGAGGNLKANQLQLIPGQLGLRLTATNPSALRGGADLSVASASAKDRQDLHQQLLAQLQQSALAELQTLADQSDPYLSAVVITPTLRLSQVLSEIYDPAENIAAEELQLTLRLEFEALVVKGSDLRRLVTPILDASLPANYQAEAASLRLSHGVVGYTAESGQANWYLSAERSIQPRLSQADVAQAGRALNLSSAAAQLQQRLGLAATPQIRVWPEWWPYLPLLPVRIQVALRLPAP